MAARQKATAEKTVLSLQSKDTAEARKPAIRRTTRRAVKAKRGEGVIFDVIDEWLAPAFARWIASTAAKPSQKGTSGSLCEGDVLARSTLSPDAELEQRSSLQRD